ncbi:MAG: hypothetical protein MRY83_10545 [Flavobacteriales bacterium]|nr:hypothetical protein [Flavobacteriales bacterium]
MKVQIFTISFFLFLSKLIFSQSVGIGTVNFNPDSSAILDLNSTNHGLLLPRLTEAQRDNINDPAQGLILYQTDQDSGFVFNSGTADSPQWTKILNTNDSITDSIAIVNDSIIVLYSNGVEIDRDTIPSIFPIRADSIRFDTAGNSLTSTNVQDALEEIANLGNTRQNTWFVSMNGNDQTAQKGNPFYAFSNPWEAIDTAQSGDLIYVFEGSYSGYANSFKYFLASTNLYKPGVNFFFEDVELTAPPCVAANGYGRRFFDITSSGTQRVMGRVDMNFYGSTYDFFAGAANVDGFDWYCEGQRLGIFWMSGGSQNGLVEIRAEQGNVGTYYRQFGSATDSIKDIVFKAHSDKVEGILYGALAITGGNIARVTHQTSYGYLDITSYSSVVNWERGMLAFQGNSSVRNDIDVKIQIDKGIFGGTSNYNLYGGYIISDSRVKYDLNCDYCEFTNPNANLIGKVVSWVSGITGDITGNYYFKNNVPAISMNRSANYNSGEYIKLNANVFSDTAIIEVANASHSLNHHYILSGHYQTSSTPIINTGSINNGRLTFEDLHLDILSGDSAITSTQAINITSNNAFSNSWDISSNVTFNSYRPLEQRLQKELFSPTVGTTSLTNAFGRLPINTAQIWLLKKNGSTSEELLETIDFSVVPSTGTVNLTTPSIAGDVYLMRWFY